jgi:hypothetical protein
MRGKTRERWKELCAQAANERDPDKLIALVRQIIDLEAKENCLNRKRAADPDPGDPDQC